MGITDFLLERKIKKADQKAYNYLAKTAKAMEEDSINELKANGSSINALEAIGVLGKWDTAFDILLELDKKYIRLKEKFKYDNKELLKIVIDWRDFNILTYDLFSNKLSNWADYEIQTEEMMKRFSKLLNSE